jgi:hypothetical protein
MFCRRFKPYVSTFPPRLQRCASLFQRRCYSLPPHTDPEEDLFAALTADQLGKSLQEMGASPALLEFLRCEGWNGFHLKGICPKVLSVITLPDHDTSSLLLMRLVRDLRRREKEAAARGKTVNITFGDSETVVETFCTEMGFANWMQSRGMHKLVSSDGTAVGSYLRLTQGASYTGEMGRKQAWLRKYYRR